MLDCKILVRTAALIGELAVLAAALATLHLGLRMLKSLVEDPSHFLSRTDITGRCLRAAPGIVVAFAGLGVLLWASGKLIK